MKVRILSILLLACFSALMLSGSSVLVATDKTSTAEYVMDESKAENKLDDTMKTIDFVPFEYKEELNVFLFQNAFYTYTSEDPLYRPPIFI